MSPIADRDNLDHSGDLGSVQATASVTLRERLLSAGSRGIWRSLDELLDTPEFRKWVEDEFPHRESLLGMDRRRFLQLMGASLALAGITGCRFLPQRRAVPFVKAVEEEVPGKPLFYASAIVLSGIAAGVLVESHEGRPTKIEGNPLHPASLGSTDLFTQAAILDLYDPDRSRNVVHAGDVATWPELLAALRSVLDQQHRKAGAGLRILSGAITSPSLMAQMDALRKRLPKARWYQWEAANRDNVCAGMRQAFGRPLNPVYRLDRAHVVVTLDADLLTGMPGSVRYARDFMGGRRVRANQRTMNRLYAVECSPTNTGAVADHRLTVRAQDIHAVTAQLAHAVMGSSSTHVPTQELGDDYEGGWLAACARDLLANRSRCLVVAGDGQPAAVHVLAAAMNEFLGNVGHTVAYTAPIYAEWSEATAQLQELASEIASGRVDALLVLGANPVYDAPADMPFADLIRRVPFTAHLGLHLDETGCVCQWHAPLAHGLESWGDARSYDGTVTFRQPLIQPLFDGKSIPEIVSVLVGRPADGYELHRAYWTKQFGGTNAAKHFRRAIHDGLIENSSLPSESVRVREDAVRTAMQVPARKTGGNIEVVFAPDPTLYDGRFANNGWLQELPKAMTRLTWDNAALLAPSTAHRLGINDGDVLEIRAGDRSIEAPAKLQPGHAKDSLTLHLGGGRSRAGTVGNGVGFSAYVLRDSQHMWLIADAIVARMGRTHSFATTEQHHAMDRERLDGQHGRDIVRVLQLGAFDVQKERTHGERTSGSTGFYDGNDHKYDGYAWGMAIDLTLCTGCNACVVACQAENNIPVVGKEQVARGREMHWIRIDRYYEGPVDDPAVHQQPVLCMHCEQAPCEPVCPVAATVHSHEGLNQMVYNRCVGTRYCSNNCPYKVRRFNFLNYANHTEPTILQLLRNPNVTVRGRGVMEKCTFCVQRINAARIGAKKEGRSIRDGEIITACQGACPTRAIVFGNIADPDSEVSRLKREPHDYSLLEDLDTRPRVTYLARVTNPNPDSPAGAGLDREAHTP